MLQRPALLVAATLTLAAVAAAPAPAAADVIDPEVIPDVAEKVVDSVVNVATSREIEIDPVFADPTSPFYVPPERRVAQGVGSGVVVTAEGRILTSAHVVHGAEQIRVTLSDGNELDAELLGLDLRTDLAVLQLRGEVPRLTPLAFGDSSRLRLGEIVLAVGNPLGVGQSVTMGIVSAKGRSAVGLVDYEDFIQTDAAINPGNSGGALVNLDGELVGINTGIASRTGGSDGIAFAIPSDMAKPIMEMLVIDGKVTRGYIGVGLDRLTRAFRAEHAVAAARGAVVREVVAKSPAARAGLEAGDVVTHVDGHEVADVGQLRTYIAMRGVGKRLELTVARGKRTLTVDVTTAELPEPKAPVRAP